MLNGGVQQKRRGHTSFSHNPKCSGSLHRHTQVVHPYRTRIDSLRVWCTHVCLKGGQILVHTNVLQEIMLLELLAETVENTREQKGEHHIRKRVARSGTIVVLQTSRWPGILKKVSECIAHKSRCAWGVMPAAATADSSVRCFWSWCITSGCS